MLRGGKYIGRKSASWPRQSTRLDESIGNWVSVAFYSRKSRFANLPNRIPHGIGYPSSIVAPTLTSQISATTWRLLKGRNRGDRGKEILSVLLVTSAMSCVCESWLCIQGCRLYIHKSFLVGHTAMACVCESWLCIQDCRLQYT